MIPPFDRLTAMSIVEWQVPQILNILLHVYETLLFFL